MYPSTSLFIAMGQLAIVVLVLFSYPLQVHPCRNCLDKVFNPSHAMPPKVVSAEAEDEDEDESVIGGDEHGHVAHTEMSSFKHNALTAGIVIAGFTIAYLVDDLQMGEHFIILTILWRSLTSYSFVVCWSNWLHYYLFYFARPVLLEGAYPFTILAFICQTQVLVVDPQRPQCK